MVESLNWVSGTKSIIVEAANSLSMYDNEWVTFAAQIETLNSNMPMKSLEYTQESTYVYKYKLKTKDNRVWKQTLTFAPENQTDPYMTFDVVDGFKLSEFKSHRDIRESIVSLTKRFGITKIECKW